MGKKKKRQPKTSSNQTTLSLEEREARALRDFEAGRLRRARDAYKELAKTDRDRFLPKVIDCNIALATEMTANGQHSEAQQVLAYLQTVAPPETLAVAQLPIALAREEWDSVAAIASAALDAGKPDESAGQVRLSDALLLAGREPPPPTSQTIHPWRDDFQNIRRAFQALSEERFDEVRDLIRPIGRESAFAEWKLLLRGLLAFYTGEEPRAARFFAELSPRGLPRKTSAPFSDLIDAKSSPQIPEERILILLELLGLAPKEAETVAVAEIATRFGDHVRAAQLLRSLPGFSPANGGWKAALFEYLVCVPFSSGSEVGRRFVGFFKRALNEDDYSGPVDAMLVSRIVALSANNDIHTAESAWIGFARHYEAAFGRNPQLTSRIYLHLGTKFAEIAPIGFFQRHEKMRDAEKAVNLLRLAVNINPGDLTSNLALANAYSRLKMTRERNALLDQMTKRFPREKKVLTLAGNLCIDRKSFKKGLNFLEQAHSLDQVDQETTTQLFLGLCNAARGFYNTQKCAQARDAFARARELTRSLPDGPSSGIEYALAREGILEEIFGDPAVGKTKIVEALAAAKDPLALRFFLAGIAHVYRQRYGPNRHADPMLQTAKKEATVASCLKIWPLMAYLRAIPSKLNPPPLTQWFRTILENARQRPFTCDEVAEIGHLCGPSQNYDKQLLALIPTARKQDPKHPSLHLLELLVKDEALDRHIDKIRSEAERRNDTKTLNLLRNITAPPEMPPFDPAAFFDEDDDDEDCDDDKNFDDDFDNDDPDEEAAFQQLKQLVATLSDSKFREFKRDMAKTGIPGALLDQFRAEVKRAKKQPRQSTFDLF